MCLKQNRLWTKRRSAGHVLNCQPPRPHCMHGQVWYTTTDGLCWAGNKWRSLLYGTGHLFERKHDKVKAMSIPSALHGTLWNWNYIQKMLLALYFTCCHHDAHYHEHAAQSRNKRKQTLLPKKIQPIYSNGRLQFSTLHLITRTTTLNAIVHHKRQRSSSISTLHFAIAHDNFERHRPPRTTTSTCIIAL